MYGRLFSCENNDRHNNTNKHNVKNFFMTATF